MSFRVRFAHAARDDLKRLYALLLERDLQAARRGRAAIDKGVLFLQEFPFSCRKSDPEDPFLRELLIPFGSAGCVALFEIENDTTVTILAIRHQREEDYH